MGSLDVKPEHIERKTVREKYKWVIECLVSVLRETNMILKVYNWFWHFMFLPPKFYSMLEVEIPCFCL